MGAERVWTTRERAKIILKSIVMQKKRLMGWQRKKEVTGDDKDMKVVSEYLYLWP